MDNLDRTIINEHKTKKTNKQHLNGEPTPKRQKHDDNNNNNIWLGSTVNKILFQEDTPDQNYSFQPILITKTNTLELCEQNVCLDSLIIDEKLTPKPNIITDLSTRKLSAIEERLLNKGLSFVPTPPKENTLKSLIPSLRTLIQGMSTIYYFRDLPKSRK